MLIQCHGLEARERQGATVTGPIHVQGPENRTRPKTSIQGVIAVGYAVSPERFGVGNHLETVAPTMIGGIGRECMRV